MCTYTVVRPSAVSCSLAGMLALLVVPTSTLAPPVKRPQGKGEKEGRHAALFYTLYSGHAVLNCAEIHVPWHSAASAVAVQVLCCPSAST